MTRREQIVKLIESDAFQRTIVGVIVFNAITLGLETSESIMAEAGDLLHALDRTVIVVFIVELLLRGYAYRSKFLPRSVECV